MPQAGSTAPADQSPAARGGRQLIAKRGEILAKFLLIARTWLMLLRGCRARDDTPELEELKADIVAFSAWAQKELEVLRRLREEESVLDQ